MAWFAVGFDLQFEHSENDIPIFHVGQPIVP